MTQSSVAFLILLTSFPDTAYTDTAGIQCSGSRLYRLRKILGTYSTWQRISVWVIGVLPWQTLSRNPVPVLQCHTFECLLSGRGTSDILF